MLTLGFKTPYFRNINSKKDTQSFFESPLPTSLTSVGLRAQLQIARTLLKLSKEKRKEADTLCVSASFLAPLVGLEPTTCGLTVDRYSRPLSL